MEVKYHIIMWQSSLLMLRGPWIGRRLGSFD